MLVGDSGNVFIETRHPAYGHLQDFLISCCEPVSRTAHIEEYRLDSASLSAATAEGTYTCDMIRTVLRHFRLDDTGNMAVDLDRYTALEKWAGSPEADDDPTSYQSLPFMTYSSAREVRVNEDAAKADHLNECSPHEAAGGSDSCASPQAQSVNGMRRTLRLAKRPRTPSSCTSPEGECPSPTAVMSQPVVTHAVVRPEALQPLPEAVEAMLREEEAAAKVRVVLQPRLRRFTPMPSARPLAATAASTATTCQGGEEELLYFLVSRERAYLQRAVERVREYVEPVQLYGTERWVITDIDHGMEEQGMDLSGRGAVVRRLFAVAATGADPVTDARRVSRIVYKCAIRPGKLRHVKECLFKELGIRADCFYAYLEDPTLTVDNLQLAPEVRLRPYQVASLERFRRGSKAHQGVVVLPCGAGKTLTGIGAAATMRKRTIVMCINNMSVFQWQREFRRWTNLKDDEVTVCTAKQKQMPGEVFITTYSMLVAKRGNATGQVARETEEILDAVRREPWGLLLLDEVHTALAHHFKEVLNQLKYKCVLGLSATLLREDDKIGDLRHLVGPKLYEANWLQLTRAGYLARVECAEVQCTLPQAYFSKYTDAVQLAAARVIGTRGGATRNISHYIASCNPMKLWTTQALLNFHRNRTPPDKVILFCDYLADVRFYSTHLHLPFMDQRTSESERENLLQYFQHSDKVNAIILTRVGDVALDLPCASVLIQISGLGASRRQEAQRLGRILRPKPPSIDNTCSYHYTLVSQYTHEVNTSYKRQSWLRDQGFAYRVLHSTDVLAAYRRTGGTLCCVGPPRWWYEVLATPSSSGHTERMSAKEGALTQLRPTAYAGSHWMPFSADASARIEYSFLRGHDGCVLSEQVLGDGTVRPSPEDLGGVAVAPHETWEVRFSSANAPDTFGTVKVGESEESSFNVRRIRCGPLDDAHNCLADDTGECLTYALSQLQRHCPRDNTVAD